MNQSNVAENEAQAFELYRRTYTLNHPVQLIPQSPSVSWQPHLLILVSIPTVLAASLITFQRFYQDAHLNGSESTAALEAAAAVLVLVGGLVIYSMIDGMRRKKESKLMGWGVAIVIAVSIMAGIGNSIHQIAGVDPTFLTKLDYFMSIVIGISATLLVWILGDSLGGQLSAIGTARNKVDRDYEEYLDRYNQELVESWDASDEKKFLLSELLCSEEGNIPPSRIRPTLPRIGLYTAVRQKIMGFLKREFEASGRIPGPTEIAKCLNVSKGYAHQVRLEWIQDKGEAI